MKYSIEFKTSAAKVLKSIPKRDRIRICDKIDSMSEKLPDRTITKLKGDNPFYRVRVGDYRIIYEIQDEILLILVLKIGHRKDIYRKFPQ